MSKPIAAFETEIEDDFEEVALLPESDQPRSSGKAAPSWKSRLLGWLPSDGFTGRDGFEKLDQTDSASEVSRQTGIARPCSCGHLALHVTSPCLPAWLCSLLCKGHHCTLDLLRTDCTKHTSNQVLQPCMVCITQVLKRTRCMTPST